MPDYDSTKYSNRAGIKARMRANGIRIRDLAIELGMVPSTLGCKLSGYAPLDDQESLRISDAIDSLTTKGAN